MWLQLMTFILKIDNLDFVATRDPQTHLVGLMLHALGFTVNI